VFVPYCNGFWQKKLAGSYDQAAIECALPDHWGCMDGQNADVIVAICKDFFKASPKVNQNQW